MATGYLDTVGQILECRLYGNVYGQTCINTFHYYVSSVTTGGALLSAAGPVMEACLWDDGFTTGLRHMMSTGYQNASLTLQNIYPTRYVPYVFNLANTAGLISSTALPPTNTIVVRRTTARAGRKYRGRIFVPGVPTSYITGGTVNSTGTAAIPVPISALSNVQTVTGGGGSVTLQPCVFNLRAVGNRTDIIATTFDTILRQQRRREVGRGI